MAGLSAHIPAGWERSQVQPLGRPRSLRFLIHTCHGLSLHIYERLLKPVLRRTRWHLPSKMALDHLLLDLDGLHFPRIVLRDFLSDLVRENRLCDVHGLLRSPLCQPPKRLYYAEWERNCAIHIRGRSLPGSGHERHCYLHRWSSWVSSGIKQTVNWYIS